MEPKSKRPFVSITDFTDHDQVRKMAEIFRENRPQNSRRRLGIGVMTDRNSLEGKVPKRYSKVWPSCHQIPEIFKPVDDIKDKNYHLVGDDLMFCVHYADYALPYSDDYELVIVKALLSGGLHVDAIQLDMIWPDPLMIKRFQRYNQHRVEVILQVGETAFQMARYDPSQVVKRLKAYGSDITHVLLDRSMGRGKPLSAEFMQPFVSKIRKELPDLGIGIAGGLGPDTINLLDSFEEISSISICSQGQMRSSGKSTEPIEWDRSERYITEFHRKYV